MSSEARSPALLIVRQWWLPLLSLFILSISIGLTPPRNPIIHKRTPLEVVAHNLGHSINSVWVGVSLILLIVPSLVAWWVHQRPDMWAWRALDAILLDFLMVDGLGKDLIKSLGRPGHPEQPGFPSGHATMAYLMAWLVWQRFPKLGPLWFLMATLISWSRIESHAHFPYQVFAGMIYGCGLAALIMFRKAGVLLPKILLTDSRLRTILTK